ncbi:MAG: tetratricopeptide repeat protein [Acidobacteriaceae bacterium]
MRRSPLIVASIAVMLSAPVFAQQSGQAVPDTPQPQSQKKPAPKPKSTQGANDTANDKKASDSKPSGKDDNAFPEDVSKDAAAKAAGSSDSAQQGNGQGANQKSGEHSPASDNPFPESESKAAADSGSSQKNGQSSTATDNPFPEAESKAAAKAAGNDSEPAAPVHDVPPGVSSSSSGSTSMEDIAPASPGKVEPDPGRAKKDAEVGGFYLKGGDYQGALSRFQDAMTYDPTNVDAIFGLAEAQRMLKKDADAARNYQLYLDIVPDGPKSKQALKALKALVASGSGG